MSTGTPLPSNPLSEALSWITANKTHLVSWLCLGLAGYGYLFANPQWGMDKLTFLATIGGFGTLFKSDQNVAANRAAKK